MSQPKIILKRNQLAAEDKWKVEKIYADEKIWQADFEKAQQLLEKAAPFNGTLSDGADQFFSFLHYEEELSLLVDRLYLYASMRSDEDKNEPLFQSLKERIQSLAVEASSLLSFFSPQLLAIRQELLEAYLQDSRIAPYRKMIEDITRLRPHTLKEEEERILAMTGEMAVSYKTIFTMLNTADIDFPTITNSEGEEEQLSHGKYIRFLESSDRRVRKEAFDKHYATYEKKKNTFAALYGSSVKKNVFYARARNYADSRSASLFVDDVPVSVYDNLIETVHQNLPLYWQYLEDRRKLLAVDELHLYDVYAPLFADFEKEYDYNQAKEMMLAGLAPLGEDYGRIVAQGLAQGWVDVYENVGKTPGAYSTGTYDTEPYILMNYQANLNSVFTLAHEMGHSMHSYFSAKAQPYVYSSYSIFVAEVASTVNEILLLQHLLKNATQKGEKLSLYNYYLEQFRGTVFRQTMFAEFEKICHATVESGVPLTVENLNQIYYDLNKLYFGENKVKNLVIDEAIALEWARIPHFYSAFYVYKYATGFSAASAIAAGLLQPDEKKAKVAQQNYLKFLSAGCSLDPIDALKLAGVDMTKPEPVEEAMKIFEAMLKEMEHMAL